jgi:hypothetical protein
MKKYFSLIIFISLSASAAIELKFIGPCSDRFIMRTLVEGHFENVGELTIETLKKFNIPYEGSYEGLSSAFETPTADAALEVISADEMRAYGWCFSVNGIAPEVYPHQVPVTEVTKTVVWHFGYARYLRGKWITQCTPAWKVKPAFLCEGGKTK